MAITRNVADSLRDRLGLALQERDDFRNEAKLMRQAGRVLEQQLDETRDELARLRQELDVEDVTIPVLRIERDKARAEVERLKRHVPGGCKMLSLGDACECKLCLAEAEVERLRALLREVRQSGVECDVLKNYVTVQIDRDLWADLQKALEERDA